MTKKVRKSRILASQTPPKTPPKSFQNRCPKKHAIFHRFLFEKCSVAKMPTSIPYWFLQYKMALGRFSSSCFLRGFGVQKTIQKPLKNHARATQKSISKTCCFLTSIFSRFGLDFGASWALLGRSWALLGASWALLGCLLRALGCLLAAKCCPRGTRARFWRVLGVSGEAFGGPQTQFFEVFPYISL